MDTAPQTQFDKISVMEPDCNSAAEPHRTLAMDWEKSAVTAPDRVLAAQSDQTSVARFYIAGIAVRTTNENGQATRDIPALWSRFFSDQVMAAIKDRMSDALYCVYTDYEGDFTKPYTTILGCRVKDLTQIPAGLTGKCIEGGTYTTFVAKGKLAEQIVYKEWSAIWNSDLPRSYVSDFEIYGEKANDPDAAEVPIFIGLRC